MTRQPRSVFFGTPSFALPVLDALCEVTDIALVITRADKPAGRGQRLQPSPVNVRATALKIPVATPIRLNDEALVRRLRDLKPDVVVVAAYGKIIPPNVLECCEKGFINVHPSLLPHHRGPSPIAATILAGDRGTGITLILLDAEMDHGPVMAQEHLPIDLHEHRPHLEARLATLGATLLKKTLPAYLDGTLQPIPQDHRQATFTKVLHRDDARIQWQLSADHIERQVRAYDPWPGTETTFKGSLLKILDARANSIGRQNGKPGMVVLDNTKPSVICGRGLLQLNTIQVPGKKSMDAAAFARGHQAFIGGILGQGDTRP